MKKLLLVLLLVAVLLIPGLSNAQEAKTVYHFYSKYCPHCIDQNIFLEELPKQYPDITVLNFEVTSDPDSADLFKKFADLSNNESLSVPVVYIGEYFVLGYNNESGKGQEIKDILDYYEEKEYLDPLQKAKAGQEFAVFSKGDKNYEDDKDTVTIPIVGKVSVKNLSILPLTVVLGLADGFNPCAMWALLALLSLLVALNSRKKILLVGGTFLITSWIIYFIFLATFLNVFHFIKFDYIIRPVIALVAIYTSWQLLNSAKKQDEECKVSSGKARIYKQIEKISQTTFVPLLILGAIALALMVNLVEFMCSVNLPIVYTKVLSGTDLSRLHYYSYLALYNTLYMLDDFIVFLLALFSLNIFLGVNKKYARLSKVIGGIIILAVGILLLVYPQALSF
jgi:thiol-disulfide isomerase/thioredoxin